MKKRVLLVLICLLCFMDCNAFSKRYKYNYEITSVDFNGTSGIINGWAILNAGVNDKSSGSDASPKYNSNLDSNDTNPYNYSLKIYGMNGNKEVKYINGTRVNTNQIKAINNVLYDNSVSSSGNAQYYNVYFKFDYNFNDFVTSGKFTPLANPTLPIDSYKFILTVSSTKGKCATSDTIDGVSCSQTFNLSFLETAMSNSAKTYFSSSTYLDGVKILINNANYRKKSCFTGGRYKNSNGSNFHLFASKYNDVYDLLERQTCDKYDGKLNFYKINLIVGNESKKGWVPSTWIVPPSDSITILTIPESCNVNGNSMPFGGKNSSNNNSTCNLSDEITDNAKLSCTTPKNSTYFNVECNEKIQSKFIPIKLNSNSSESFDGTLKIVSRTICNATFDYTKWKQDYDRGNESVKNSLNAIKNNFLNYKMNDYDTNPSATIQYEMSNKKSNLNFKIIDRNNLESNSIVYKYLDSSNKEPVSFEYSTNKEEVTLQLINQVVIKNEKNIPYEISISNIGYNKKSKSYLNCVIEIPSVVFRSVDVVDPFIKNQANRTTGQNWLNDNYDFTGLIKSDVWDNNAKYIFTLSKQNINNIVKKNKEDGADAYIGIDCEKGVDGKFHCPFLRNETYFSGIYIDNEWLIK